MVRDSLEMSHSASFPPSKSDDDFAEMPAAFHISQGLGHLFERKCFIDRRPQPIGFYGVVHFFKHLARANENMPCIRTSFIKILLRSNSPTPARPPITAT